jgi:hypothetical protein
MRGSILLVFQMMLNLALIVLFFLILYSIFLKNTAIYNKIGFLLSSLSCLIFFREAIIKQFSKYYWYFSIIS